MTQQNDRFFISRRQFLQALGVTGLTAVSTTLLPPLFALTPQNTRLEKWIPNSANLIEWRYLAGRITDATQDFGFILSVSFIRLPGDSRQELLVQRQDLAGSGNFVGNTYSGTLSYDAASATYTFVDETAVSAVTWTWDEALQQYRLTANTPELVLTDLVLQPQGALIPEGGDGDINVGRAQGIPVVSNYDADWVLISQDGVEKGVGRLDMQGLRPSFLRKFDLGQAEPDKASRAASQDVEPGGYDHDWFAVAAELVDGTAVWISAWRIEDDISGPYWTTTIATGSGQNWAIATSLTETSTTDALVVTEQAWQPLPPSTGVEHLRVGRVWRIQAPNNVLDITVGVIAGQLTISPRHAGLLGQAFMVEAVGTEASGTVNGVAIASTKLAVAESTHEFYTSYIPIIRK
ncbi:MAG: twin-arginine translocation signal domain-containing protein [Chloroflexota bacterium]